MLSSQYHYVYDAWPVWCQTCSYLPSFGQSPPFHQYRIILHGGKSMYIHRYIHTWKQLSLNASVSNRIKHVSDLRCCLQQNLSANGGVFHIFGPKFEKLLFRNRVFVRGTTQVLVSAEGRRWSVNDNRRQWSATYSDIAPQATQQSCKSMVTANRWQLLNVPNKVDSSVINDVLQVWNMSTFFRRIRTAFINAT